MCIAVPKPWEVFLNKALYFIGMSFFYAKLKEKSTYGAYFFAQ
jgi:hypothetical protein